jgi:drug/metabolite transporter (DMT)-like permease
VNPVVALLLGALFLAEPLTPRVVSAAAVILLSVAVVQRSTSPKIKA